MGVGERTRRKATEPWPPGERRQSSRPSTLKRSIEREEREQQARQRPKRKRPKVERRVLTQAERMAEAEHTEVLNRQSLADLLRQEEEKKRVVERRVRFEGPTIRFVSRNGKSLLAFKAGFPPELDPNAPQPQPAKRGQLCVVTGKPALYVDPRSKLPFANVAAYRQLRASKKQ
jgi:vacuolar protein sorting-associated protein 72